MNRLYRVSIRRKNVPEMQQHCIKPIYIVAGHKKMAEMHATTLLDENHEIKTTATLGSQVAPNVYDGAVK